MPKTDLMAPRRKMTFKPIPSCICERPEPKPRGASRLKHSASVVLRNSNPHLWHRLKYWQYLRSGEREIQHLKGLVDPRRAAIDAGVFLGFYTRKLSELTPVVFGFEPHDENYDWAVRCLPRTAQLRHMALSDEDGSVTLRIPVAVDSGESALSTCSEANSLGRLPCRCLSVPRCRLDSLNLPPVGFIKIDVEGIRGVCYSGRDGAASARQTEFDDRDRRAAQCRRIQPDRASAQQPRLRGFLP